MARAENLAGLGCMPYLPHTASTATAEKIQKNFPLLGGEAWLDGTICGRRNRWRSCLLQLFKLRLNSCPVLWFSLRRVRSIRMSIELQKLSPNLQRSTAETLLR